MAAIKTGGPKENSTIDGNFRRICLEEGGYIPTSSSDTNGKLGEVSWDTGYIYVKTAAGTWKRATLSSF
jgi:hypothetical protein